jgi:soluble lytic murein transglycosylase
MIIDSGFIARLGDRRLIRLVVLLVLSTLVAASQPGQGVIDSTVRYQRSIVRWTAQANFQQPALMLNRSDRALYYRIFTLQGKGQWAKADALISRLHDPLLVGHILYQRYLINPDYHSNFAELNGWLQDFGDHPHAERVYHLAQRRHGATDGPIVKPVAVPVLAAAITTPVTGAIGQNWANLEDYVQRRLSGLQNTKIKQKPQLIAQADTLARQIKNDIAHDHVSTALDRFNSSTVTPKLNSVQQGVLLTQIAFGYYYNGKYARSRLVAQRAWRLRGQHQLIADWVSGLAAWRLEEYGPAEQYFARISKAGAQDHVDPWFAAAGSFWASRAAGRQGNQAGRMSYLEQAALYPTTFYGLLAHNALGYQLHAGPQQNENAAPLDQSDAMHVLTSYRAGERALALFDLGQNALAAAELQQLLAQDIAKLSGARAQNNLYQALAWAADEFALKDMQSTLAQRQGYSSVLQAVFHDDTAFPVLQEAVASSKTVDPALIHALIRQESRFDPKARNRTTGAAGLMQLMPRTARFMGAKQTVSAQSLLNPAVNLQLGQRYVDYLLRQPHINNNLFYLTVAYNAGPGNLQNWQRKLDDDQDDPLLFIESIPFSQTRAFVERVMTNYWIYRLRLGQDVPSLKALVNGQWPQHEFGVEKYDLASLN